MGLGRRLFFVFFLGVFFTCKASFAQIEYSLPPTCKNNKVECSNPSEKADCLILTPRIHEEKINADNNNSRFKPDCDPDYLPTCIDTVQGDEIASNENVVLTCVEVVKCNLDKNGSKLITGCSGGKVAKCLGSDDVPDCVSNNSDAVCKHGVAVCDYNSWQITSVQGPPLQ